MKYTHQITGSAVTIILSTEVMDLLTEPKSRNFAPTAEAFLRRLAARGRGGMASKKRFRDEGKKIWALKPMPVRIYGWFDEPGERFFVAAVSTIKKQRKMDPNDFQKACRLRTEFRRVTDALNLSELEK